MVESQVEELVEKPLGILDISPQNIKEPPQFTEQATIEAMNNLEVVPNDLVPLNFKQSESFNDDSPMRLQITLELERQRLEKIEKIIKERNRLLSLPTPDIQEIHMRINKSTPRRKKRKSTIPKYKKKKGNKERRPKEDASRHSTTSKKSKQKIISKNNSKITMPKVKHNSPTKIPGLVKPIPNPTPIFKPKQIKNQIKEDIMERQNKQTEENEKDKMNLMLEIRRKAIGRMQQVMEEQKLMKMKKEQRMKEQLAESQRKEKQYMKLQEKKRKEFEKKQKLRNKKLYGNSLPEKKENHFAELRKKIIQSQANSVSNSRVASPINEKRDDSEYADSIIVSSEKFIIKTESKPMFQNSNRRSKIPMLRKKKT